MSVPTVPPKKKLPIAKLAIVGGVLLVAAAIALYFLGWREALAEGKRIFDATLNVIAGAGPVLFFAAMATLPVFGAPMGPFAIMAGLVFREKLGLPVVLLLGVGAMAFNIAITYWMARKWLRPPLTRLVTKWGYTLPQVEGGDATSLILLLRVTPGPPFFVQNYLLGLAEVPFGRYMVLSCLAQGTLLGGLVVFGDALGQGSGKVLTIAAGAVVGILIGTHFLRKHLARKKAAATPVP